jgi:hypothetical protein
MLRGASFTSTTQAYELTGRGNAQMTRSYEFVNTALLTALVVGIALLPRLF